MKVAWLQLSSKGYVFTIQLGSLCHTATGTTHILIISDLVIAVTQLTFTLDSSD